MTRKSLASEHRGWGTVLRHRWPTLLAAAWLGHGVWDVAHHLANRVVPRWYAELCAVLDVSVAVGIILAVPHV